MIALFSVGAHSGAAWRLVWYQENFMHWAVNMVDYMQQRNTKFVLELSHREQETRWCELEGCPYLYVTRRSYGFQSANILNHGVARVSQAPEVGDYQSIHLHWGARWRQWQQWWHLNRDGDKIESKDEGVMRDITNGVPMYCRLMYSEQKNCPTKGQISLVSQIAAQRTKVNSWEIHTTKVDILSFVTAKYRSLVPAIGLIYNLQYGTLHGTVFLRATPLAVSLLLFTWPCS